MSDSPGNWEERRWTQEPEAKPCGGSTQNHEPAPGALKNTTSDLQSGHNKRSCCPTHGVFVSEVAQERRGQTVG